MALRINSLKELKEWNANPTKELPIVYDWFLPWFFKEVLMKDKIKLIKDAHETHIRFCMICNNFTIEQAIQRININLGYYAGYSKAWYEKLDKYFPEIKHPILGKNYHS
jgi:hypothetical protein